MPNVEAKYYTEQTIFVVHLPNVVPIDAETMVKIKTHLGNGQRIDAVKVVHRLIPKDRANRLRIAKELVDALIAETVTEIRHNSAKDNNRV